MARGDSGERALIRQIRQRFADSTATLGIGDDAAVVEIPAGYSLLFCSDLVTERYHFLRDRHPADSIGYKAVAVNVSDVGAMGGVPMYFLISIGIPGDIPGEWLDAFYDGIARACRDFEVALVGGDTSSADAIFVDVSMIGRVLKGKAVTRAGAKPGDGIYVTGSLGGSASGLELLRAGRSGEPAVMRHLYPQPRHKVGAAVAGIAHAMIDVSDGLSTDLGHILDDSKVSAQIKSALLPRAQGASEAHVLHGGEEYELLIVAPDLPASIDDVPVTRIGEIVTMDAKPELRLDGVVLPPGGWEHL
jgi:thiamine-monophosphate kinase